MNNAMVRNMFMIKQHKMIKQAGIMSLYRMTKHQLQSANSSQRRARLEQKLSIVRKQLERLE